VALRRSLGGRETPGLLCDCETYQTHLDKVVKLVVFASPAWPLSGGIEDGAEHGPARDTGDLLRTYLPDESLYGIRHTSCSADGTR
jgi:hypothetical protein